MEKRPSEILISGLATAALLALGYFSFGFWTTVIFASGFLGGYFFWIFLKRLPEWETIRAPYFLSFALFVFGHKVEENVFEFQKELSKITSVPVPEVTSLPLILLVLGSVGGWLMIPTLLKRRSMYGHYLACTFFFSMGIVELAHFIFPLFKQGPYGYFPGMASVIVLAPAAWWGIIRLARNQTVPD